MESTAAVLHDPVDGDVSEHPPATIQSIDVPDPVGEEVRVEVRTASLCHTDVAIARGDFDEEYPLVMGHEGAGVVDAVGEDVETVAPGDHVVFGRIACGRCEFCRTGRSQLCTTRSECTRAGTLRTGEVRFRADGEPVHHCHGVSSFTEYTLVTEEVAIAITDAVGLREAPLLGCGVFTGVGAVLNSAEVEVGSSVAVFGAGGVGLSVIQAASLVGATDVVAVDVVDWKLALATDLGATRAIDATEGDPVAAIDDHLGDGADYTFETVGRVGTLEQAIAALAPSGTAVAIGTPAHGSLSVDIPVNDFVTTEKRLVGSFNGSYNIESAIPRVADLVADGRIELEPLITDSKPLSSVNEAMADLVEGEQIRQLIVP